jgi:hypothetical protein
VAQHRASLRADLIAALYVEKDGVYYGLPDVDPWDEERDARQYAGPWPVVAHPPCSRWCLLAGLVEHMYGYKRGDDEGCFAAALDAVRRFGGVLEHPAHSQAWKHYQLPRPGRHGWTGSLTDQGVTTEVSQSAYGHSCQKRTWLYAVGVDTDAVALSFAEPPATEQVSDFFGHPKGSWLRSSRGTGMTHGESSRTPLLFRNTLLDLARSVQPPNPPTRSEHSLEGTAVNGPMPVGERESFR